MGLLAPSPGDTSPAPVFPQSSAGVRYQEDQEIGESVDPVLRGIQIARREKGGKIPALGSKSGGETDLRDANQS